MKQLTIPVLAFSFASAVAIHVGTVRAQDSDRIEDVQFSNGEILLAGRLYLPHGTGSFPAVVFTHGSGDSGRDNPRYDEEAREFVKSGIACLLFDKRGCGESTGNWRTATFADLAGDAIAGIRYLKTRDEIDHQTMGLRGASQSGWILPIAARRSPDVGFLILISPPGVSPYDQVLYDVRTDLEDEGFPAAQVEAGIRLTRSGLDYARSWKGWREHIKRLEAASEEPWLKIAAGPRDPDHWLWRWIHPVIDFDAIPVIEELRIPVLVLLGEQDRETPSQVAGYRFGKALEGNTGSHVRYFPEGDHDLRSTTASDEDGRRPFANGFLETMKNWILKQAGT